MTWVDLNIIPAVKDLSHSMEIPTFPSTVAYLLDTHGKEIAAESFRR